MTGTIVKAISGFYYVASDDVLGQSEHLREDFTNQNVFECKARGVFKNKGLTPLVGDIVDFEPGLVTGLHKRRNSFDRPPVANVETLVIVMAGANPDPSFLILDKFILTAEQKGVDIALCLNKCDITNEETVRQFEDIYGKLYPVFTISVKSGKGTKELKEFLTGKRAALAGPSGVGKSSLTNLLLSRDESKIGEISQKSQRGKNTTRHTQLFSGDGFMLFDTPGFTSFDADISDELSLAELFPEFKLHLGSCRFDDCRHINEPDCSVRQALMRGEIAQSRYDSYIEIFKSISENRRY